MECFSDSVLGIQTCHGLVFLSPAKTMARECDEAVVDTQCSESVN